MARRTGLRNRSTSPLITTHRAVDSESEDSGGHEDVRSSKQAVWRIASLDDEHDTGGSRKGHGRQRRASETAGSTRLKSAEGRAGRVRQRSGGRGEGTAGTAASGDPDGLGRPRAEVPFSQLQTRGRAGQTIRRPEACRQRKSERMEPPSGPDNESAGAPSRDGGAAVAGAVDRSAAEVARERLLNEGHERAEGDRCPICYLYIGLPMHKHANMRVCCMKLVVTAVSLRRIRED
ncbi:hypothetical protein THAOC_03640 [Thalassiosira oceanica]|uniref:Uncharacterized protein n=1 Tax=Thalassiosira oceanica TaxID=159749 RepID=K0TB20_THAOC|nr:hypothetical protein THAOC_03640 [Thalassiosira oceanica]|eukprot:EJK74670.1 hypothetical protein THAOC_03640 [Thalassiosira oceanica]